MYRVQPRGSKGGGRSHISPIAPRGLATPAKSDSVTHVVPGIKQRHQPPNCGTDVGVGIFDDDAPTIPIHLQDRVDCLRCCHLRGSGRKPAAEYRRQRCRLDPYRSGRRSNFLAHLDGRHGTRFTRSRPAYHRDQNETADELGQPKPPAAVGVLVARYGWQIGVGRDEHDKTTPPRTNNR